jgi:hypothetical protein
MRFQTYRDESRRGPAEPARAGAARASTISAAVYLRGSSSEVSLRRSSTSAMPPVSVFPLSLRFRFFFLLCPRCPRPQDQRAADEGEASDYQRDA